MKPMRGRTICSMVFAVLLACSLAAAESPPSNSITVVSSHLIGKSKAELSSKGGLCLYVKVDDKAILFDTGDEASPLLKDLEELGLDAAQIDAVVFSHGQLNRTSGELLDELSATEGNPKIYVPATVINEVLRRNPDANLFAVSKPTRVLADAWLVGPMQLDTEDGSVVEQALVLDQPAGLVVIVGCSFPSIPSLVQQVKEVFGFRRIKLVAGGFHLQATPKNDIREISLSLQQKGVKGLAVSQCTGEPALKIFRQEWGDQVVTLESGKTIRF